MLDEVKMLQELKDKNIKFNVINEKDAMVYLKNNCNYFNLIMYFNNFLKYPSPAGRFEGKFIDLDFAYLKDISILDQLLRILLYEMIMDIEYYLKLRIYRLAKNISLEDGFRIVNLYLEKDYNSDKRVHKSILEKIGSSEYKEIFDKYDIDKDKKLENIPLWEFMKIITFGELINFYDFFTLEYNFKDEHKYVFILRDVKRIRNCVCHNNGVLCDLNSKDNEHHLSSKITKYLEKCNISLYTINNKLSNTRIRQITCVLYMFNIIVTSESIKQVIKKKIKKYFLRIELHKEYYNNNKLLQSVYKYFFTLVKNRLQFR